MHWCACEGRRSSEEDRAVLKGYQMSEGQNTKYPFFSTQQCLLSGTGEKEKGFLKSEKTWLQHRALCRLIWILLELAGKARYTDPCSCLADFKTSTSQGRSSEDNKPNQM